MATKKKSAVSTTPGVRSSTTPLAAPVITTNGSKGLETGVRLGTGLSYWRGQLRDEYLPQLQPWSRAAKIYREMMDDSVVGALFDAIKTPLLSAEFAIAPASSSPLDKDAAIFLEENLFDMPDMEWREHVEEMLDFMGYGFALAEKAIYKHSDGRIYLKTLLPVGQETILDWGPSLDEFGNPLIVRQQYDGKTLTAPMSKLVHFTFRSRKRNPFGTSLLRSIYRPWYFKRNLEVLEAIGVERDVGNVPIARPDGTTNLSPDQITKLEEALKGFRVDEAAYLLLPAGVIVEPYAGGSKVYDVRTMIRDWQNLIRQRFFAGFINQGAEEVGTQALAKELTTFFGLVIISVQKRMLEVWRRQLIPWIFSYNDWPVQQFPKLEWMPPGKENLQALAQALGQLVTSNLITNTPELENHLRRRIQLPELLTKPSAGETTVRPDPVVGGKQVVAANQPPASGSNQT